MLLILVDGRKNVGELTRLAEGLGESFQLLTQLETEGLIEPLSAEVPPEGGMPAPDGVGEVDIEIEVDMDGAGVLRVDLDKARPLASRQLVELLGAGADELIGKLDAARDVVQFIDAMKLAYAMVRDIRGQSVADRFGDEVEASMWLA